MTVRVMWTHPCPNGCPDGDEGWTVRNRLGDEPPCDLCMNFGTITEAVRCAGCGWFTPDAGYDTGQCGKFAISMPDTFACAAWEPQPTAIGDDEGDV